MPDAEGTLERIWIKPHHDRPMSPAESATLEDGKGIVGDVQHGGRRQVTIVDAARWEAATAALGADVDPSARRANLLVTGVDLEASTDRVLRIGSARLRIRGETKPCCLMDRAHGGLRKALVPHWGGGAWADVLTGSEIRVGDSVGWE